MSRLTKSFSTPFFYEYKNVKVNVMVCGFVYFNEDNYDPDFEKNCIDCDIDSITLLGGKDNLKDLLWVLEGSFFASPLEEEIKQIGLELFERELRPLRQDDNDDELDYIANTKKIINNV